MQVQLPVRVAAPKTEIAVEGRGVKRSQVAAWLKVDERRGSCHHTGSGTKNVEVRTQRGGFVIQVRGLDAVPFARIEPVDERPDGSDGLRGVNAQWPAREIKVRRRNSPLPTSSTTFL